MKEPLHHLRLVCWRSLNGLHEGYLVEPARLGWLVKVKGSGKYIILNTKSDVKQNETTDQ